MLRVGVLVALSLACFAHGAAKADDLPDGSWAASCREGVVHRDGSFAAMCPQRNGVWIWSQVDISDCRYVENRNGRLTCSSGDDRDDERSSRRIATLR